MQFTASQIGSMGIGIASILLTFILSRRLYGAKSGAGGVSVLEFVYYITAFAGLVIGWYFNFQFMAARVGGTGGGWSDWIVQAFANPAAASASQDLFLGNLVILPIWTIADGRRCNLPAWWIYFPMSIVTSYAFAAALFLAIRERQLRANAQR